MPETGRACQFIEKGNEKIFLIGEVFIGKDQP